jgi:hypothetical protein
MATAFALIIFVLILVAFWNWLGELKEGRK